MLGNVRVMNRSGVVVGDCVGELDVDTSFKWATVLDFLVVFGTFVSTASAGSVGTVRLLCRLQPVRQI